MATCANGAQPTPGCAQGSILLRLALLGTSAVEWLDGLWPIAAAQDVFAIMGPNDLCQTNVDDPGNPTLEMLTADLTAAFLPGINAPANTLGWWVYQKCLYAAFSQCCECKDTGLPPPTPIVVTPPSNVTTYPPAPDEQPLLLRIENNQANSQSALDTLYLGLQDTNHLAADLNWRARQNWLNVYGQSWTTMQAEGYLDLLPDADGTNSNIYDQFGVVTQLTTIPPTVAQRGTLHPRLYGVGSLEWAQLPAGGQLLEFTVQRNALHYQQEFIHAPQTLHTMRVYWRLQPGVVGRIQQVARAIDGAIFPSPGAYANAWTPFAPIQPPASWQDKPFYPKPASGRTFALGGLP